MKIAVTVVVVSLAVFACTGRQAPRRHVVYVVDTTGSVSLQARDMAVSALRRVFTGLERGDSAAIIPITSDAQSDPLGRILRFQLSHHREPYDADRRRLSRELEAQLDALLEAARNSPDQQSDLVGTLRLASEELAAQDSQGQPILVCLSDFIQDDRQFDFAQDPRLARQDSARTLAARLASGRGTELLGVSVFLGSMQSLELKGLSPSRREAIRVFWMELLTRQGAHVQWATDGPGQLERFLQRTPVASSTQE